MRSSSPSTWKIVASKASHRRAALVNTAANTGWTSVGELEMTRRISAVAVCCSSASLRALVISAYDGAGGPLGLAVRGVPHAPQNFACGRFSCWHRGQGILSVSRVRIVSGRPGQRHGTRAAAGARRPGRPPGARQSRPYREPAPGASRWVPLPVSPLADPIPFSLSGAATGTALRRASGNPGVNGTRLESPVTMRVPEG